MRGARVDGDIDRGNFSLVGFRKVGERALELVQRHDLASPDPSLFEAHHHAASQAVSRGHLQRLFRVDHHHARDERFRSHWRVSTLEAPVVDHRLKGELGWQRLQNFPLPIAEEVGLGQRLFARLGWWGEVRRLERRPLCLPELSVSPVCPRRKLRRGRGEDVRTLRVAGELSCGLGFLFREPAAAGVTRR